jgi:hypothetical protein
MPGKKTTALDRVFGGATFVPTAPEKAPERVRECPESA